MRGTELSRAESGGAGWLTMLTAMVQPSVDLPGSETQPTKAAKKRRPLETDRQKGEKLEHWLFRMASLVAWPAGVAPVDLLQRCTAGASDTEAAYVEVAEILGSAAMEARRRKLPWRRGRTSTAYENLLLVLHLAGFDQITGVLRDLTPPDSPGVEEVVESLRLERERMQRCGVSQVIEPDMEPNEALEIIRTLRQYQRPPLPPPVESTYAIADRLKETNRILYKTWERGWEIVSILEEREEASNRQLQQLEIQAAQAKDVGGDLKRKRQSSMEVEIRRMSKVKRSQSLKRTQSLRRTLSLKSLKDQGRSRVRRMESNEAGSEAEVPQLPEDDPEMPLPAKLAREARRRKYEDMNMRTMLSQKLVFGDDLTLQQATIGVICRNSNIDEKRLLTVLKRLSNMDADVLHSWLTDLLQLIPESQQRKAFWRADKRTRPFNALLATLILHERTTMLSILTFLAPGTLFDVEPMVRQYQAQTMERAAANWGNQKADFDGFGKLPMPSLSVRVAAVVDEIVRLLSDFAGIHEKSFESFARCFVYVIGGPTPEQPGSTKIPPASPMTAATSPATPTSSTKPSIIMKSAFVSEKRLLSYVSGLRHRIRGETSSMVARLGAEDWVLLQLLSAFSGHSELALPVIHRRLIDADSVLCPTDSLVDVPAFRLRRSATQPETTA